MFNSKNEQSIDIDKSTEPNKHESKVESILFWSVFECDIKNKFNSCSSNQFRLSFG